MAEELSFTELLIHASTRGEGCRGIKEGYNSLIGRPGTGMYRTIFNGEYVVVDTYRSVAMYLLNHLLAEGEGD